MIVSLFVAFFGWKVAVGYSAMCFILAVLSGALWERMGLGALMALIIGGAGASIPEVSLLASIFKPRLIVAFVVTVFVVAATVGFTLGAVV